MNAKIILALALVACVEVSHATFVIGTAAVTTGTAVTLSSASVASLGLLGGVVLLKGLALGALVLSQRRRGRRSAEDDDAAFLVIANTEPAQCYRRLICDLATGTMAKSENDVIMNLFAVESSIESPKFEYSTAAKLGKMVRDVRMCEVRYSCPLSGSEIQKLFN